MKQVWPTALLLLFIAIFWEGFLYFQPKAFLLPSMSSVLHRFLESPERFWIHGLATAEEILYSIFLGLAISFPLGYWMSVNKSVGQFFQPFFVGIQSVPMFTLAPLMVFFFGWSKTSIVIPSVLMTIFPLTLSVFRGLKATPQGYLDLFRLHKASPWQCFWKLKLPFATPSIFTGLRLSASIATVGVLAGEWAGAQEGLGLFLLECRRNLDLPGVFAALFCLLFLSFLLYTFVVFLESLFKRKRSHEPRV